MPHWTVTADDDFVAHLTTIYLNDPMVAEDSDCLDVALGENPYRTGVELESGLWGAKRGKLAVLYSISHDDRIVRLLSCRLCSFSHTLTRNPGLLDQFARLMAAGLPVGCLSDFDSLELLIHRDPRGPGTRRLHGNQYSARRGQIELVYEISDADCSITITSVQLADQST